MWQVLHRTTVSAKARIVIVAHTQLIVAHSTRASASKLVAGADLDKNWARAGVEMDLSSSCTFQILFPPTWFELTFRSSLNSTSKSWHRFEEAH